MPLWRKPPPPPPPVRHFRVQRTERMMRTALNSDSLRGSAQKKQPADAPSPNGQGGGTRQWQKEAWDYYDLVGELHYAANFLGNCLSRVRLTVGLPDEDGTIGAAFDEDGVPKHADAPEALRCLRELRSDTAGESQIMRALGLNTFVAGECFLLGTEEPATGGLPAQRQWEVLSVEELREKREKKSDGTARYERIEAPSAPAVPVSDEAVVLRVWQSHPRWSYLADSAVRAVRDVLDEIVMLTREVRGQAMSRLAAAGVFVVPSEIEYEDDDAAAEDSDEGDPFTRDLIRTLATAIQDNASAASVVPFVLRAPYDYCDRIRHIEFTRPRDIEAAAKRKETVQRFAQGVDLPVEVITGHAQTTFSNAWQIDEATYKAHVEPKLQILLDALTTCYLRPLIPGTPLVVSGDVSELVAHPDRGAAADAAYDRYELSGSAYRDAKGFADTDAPDDDEVTRRVDRAIAIKGGGGFPAADDTTAPGMGPATSGNGNGAIPAGVAAAAEVAVLRAVERAGARLRSKMNGSSLRSLIDGVPDFEVGATLGPERVRSLVTSESDLFKGEFRMLRTWAAQQVGADNASVLLSAVEREARRRLYAPRLTETRP